jgi:ribonuclease HI
MVVAIFTDGACPGNGKRSAIAGWAWAAWPGGVAAGEPAHSAFGKPPGTATNQRAELMALLEGLRWSASAGAAHGPATFYTDSMYSIQCMTKWGPGWRRKGWKRDSGEPLQNLDLVQPLVELWLAEHKARGWSVQHVRGHQSGRSPEAWGNNWVDRAAVAACSGSGSGLGHGSGSGSGLGHGSGSGSGLGHGSGRTTHVGGSGSGTQDIGRLISHDHVYSRITHTERPTIASVSSESDLDFLCGTGSPQPTNTTASPAFFGSTRPTDLRRWFGGGGM